MKTSKNGLFTLVGVIFATVLAIYIGSLFSPSQTNTPHGFDGQGSSVLKKAVIVAYDSTESYGKEYLIKAGGTQTYAGALYSYKFSPGEEVYVYHICTPVLGNNLIENKFLIDKEIGDFLLKRGSVKLK